MIFKCDCSICKKYGNTTSTVYWRKIKTINSNKKITWIKSSWFAYRGFIDSKMIYMKYKWGWKYKREFNENITAKSIPILFTFFCKFLYFIEQFLYNNN
jgi:hypothetical protein